MSKMNKIVLFFKGETIFYPLIIIIRPLFEKFISQIGSKTNECRKIIYKLWSFNEKIKN